MLLKTFEIKLLNLRISFIKTLNLIEFLPSLTYYFGMYGIHSQKSVVFSWLRLMVNFEPLHKKYKSKKK